jgi:hypothetical protein
MDDPGFISNCCKMRFGLTTVLLCNGFFNTGGYALSFWTKAAAPRTVGIWVQETSEPWTSYLWSERIKLTTTWTEYRLTGIAAGDDVGAGLYFGLGGDDEHRLAGRHAVATGRTRGLTARL